MDGIKSSQMGEVWPVSKPGDEDAFYGSVSMVPQSKVEVRSYQTLVFTVEVGEYGLDDTGAIKIVQRWTPDGGAFQCHDPAAANYVTAIASNGVNLDIYCEPYPHQRPWYNGVRITVSGGYLSQGDKITVVYGDQSYGGSGYRIQTFPERRHEFKVLMDPCATGVFIPIGNPHLEIVSGAASKWVLVAPTKRKTGQEFSLGLRVEDAWGNPCQDFSGQMRIEATCEVTGLNTDVNFSSKNGAQIIRNLRIQENGIVRFELYDDNGDFLAESNPLLISDTDICAYWGDLHGQSGETVGINTMREYLEFARDIAFLDITSHQGNDFQITNAFWNEINKLSKEYNHTDHFVVYPGYEWSGNTPVGGDHNVFFRNEGEQIVRSSHALLTDRSDIGTDAKNLDELFEKLQEKDCVLCAHVGGRPADISYAEDAKLRTSVEVHSDWGTFEWIMKDAFDLGYRVGLVCNSDGHKGAPGACYPGASEFGAYSGLTCFLSPKLDRDSIFETMRSRHHYGTTGCRMHLSVEIDLGEEGSRFPIDPRISNRAPVSAEYAVMGDIVSTPLAQLDVNIEVLAHAPIERIEVLNGATVVDTIRPYDLVNPGKRICIIWQGAEYRGRGRTTHWTGNLSLDQDKIRKFEKINAWNLERTFCQQGDNLIEFDAVTTGNFGGCSIWLEDGFVGKLKINTDLVSAEIPLSDIGCEDVIFDAGGLDRKIRVFRLPEKLETREFAETRSLDRNIDSDTPIWVKVTTEDGFNAWSSPIYVINKPN